MNIIQKVPLDNSVTLDQALCFLFLVCCFLISVTIDIWGWIIYCPGHCRIVTNIGVFHPLDTRSGSSLPHDNQRQPFNVVQPLSCVGLFATPLTVAPQAPLSIAFPKQEYWSGLSFCSPGELPGPRIESTSPALAGSFFTTELS